jgi:hypothetical protein
VSLILKVPDDVSIENTKPFPHIRPIVDLKDAQILIDLRNLPTTSLPPKIYVRPDISSPKGFKIYGLKEPSQTKETYILDMPHSQVFSIKDWIDKLYAIEHEDLKEIEF